jgi:CRP-like cAMP-binding protein
MDSAIKRLKIDKAVAQRLNEALRLDGFFPEFTEEHVEKVFPRSGLYAYPKGASIVVQAARGRDLFVLQSGTLAVFREEGSGSRRVADLKEGDIFGEIGLRDGVRIATVSALVDSQVFHLAYEDIQYLLEHNHDLGDHLDSLAKQRASAGLPKDAR